MRIQSVFLVLWTLVLLGVLLAPISEAQIPTAGGFTQWDKVGHFGLFFITGFVGVFGARFLSGFKERVLFGATFGLFLAVFTELAQSLVPARNTSLYDLFADLIGVSLGLTLYVMLHRQQAIRSFLRL